MYLTHPRGYCAAFIFRRKVFFFIYAYEDENIMVDPILSKIKALKLIHRSPACPHTPIPSHLSRGGRLSRLFCPSFRSSVG